jgi:hypothetical protein
MEVPDMDDEEELRELFGDPGWWLPTPPDAMIRIRRAARRQRLRAATMAACAVVVIAGAVAGPLAFSKAGASAMTPTVQVSPRPTIQLPDVIGMPLQQAEAAIRAAVPGVRITVRHSTSATPPTGITLPSGAALPPGTAIAEAPLACSLVNPGAQITLTVNSRGIDTGYIGA